MSLQTLAHQFVDLCNQGKNFDVMEMMYAPDIVSVEAEGQQWAGKGPVIQKSRDWAKVNTFHGEQVRGPYLNGDPNANSGQFTVEPGRIDVYVGDSSQASLTKSFTIR